MHTVTGFFVSCSRVLMVKQERSFTGTCLSSIHAIKFRLASRYIVMGHERQVVLQVSIQFLVTLGIRRQKFLASDLSGGYYMRWGSTTGDECFFGVYRPWHTKFAGWNFVKALEFLIKLGVVCNSRSSIQWISFFPIKLRFGLEAYTSHFVDFAMLGLHQKAFLVPV